MARTWALELARADVTVNCIVPTAATEMTRTIPAFATHIEAGDVTGQTIGLGGDRLALWSYPPGVAAAYRDGGWTADQIARVYPTSVGRHPQPYGVAPVEEPAA